MKLLILDGNSILNRAYYGIKLLTTKDGRFTNGIYGFMNILLKLRDEIKPEAIAVTFDLKAPTFRHKMYDGYKAQRKGMPPELAEQMPVLKELLTALGYVIVTCEGYEADDIIGTLSAKCGKDNTCYIATGDRDSLQLVNENVRVLLASTKMGAAQTDVYDEAKVLETYGVTPAQLIDVKALMGDSSDNIPGVAGVGQKTAQDLISRFHSVDYIYENIDAIDIKAGVRQKLINDKDMAYLSRTLGTICKEAPVDTDIETYRMQTGDPARALEMLTSLEMFKIIDKLNLKADAECAPKTEKQKALPLVPFSAAELTACAERSGRLYFLCDIKDGNLQSLCFASDSFIMPVDIEKDDYVNTFRALLENEKIQKYTTDSKYLFRYAMDNGFSVRNVKMDLALAGYLLNPSANSYSAKRLCEEYAGKTDADESLPALCGCLVSLCGKLQAQIASREQTALLEEMEIPLAEVLASMEKCGVAVNREGIEAFNEMLTKQLDTLTAEIYADAGGEFNINSPKQLGEVLFERLQLPARKKTKSGYSTNAEVLEGLADEHEIVRKILSFRTISKLKSTYCDGLLKVIGADGRIHSSFNQTETRTGRISSAEPNLQNIPVRQELGREMRRFFTADEGMVLVDADYSQIELRVLADAANDATMLEAFNEEQDIHTATASQVFNMPASMVTPLMRSRAKAVNFGIVYGIGAFSLAKDIGVSRAEADRYIKDYFHHYSGVREYMDRLIVEARRQGYAKTLFARRRYLPELASSNKMLQAFGERVARNMPIQGTAADIIKIAMIRVYNRLRNENMKAKLILQVHDELIVEAPEEEAERAKQIVSEEMENACRLKVRLKSDANIGKTWYDAKG